MTRQEDIARIDQKDRLNQTNRPNDRLIGHRIYLGPNVFTYN